MTFTQKDGMLMLSVDGQERKIKISGDARYFLKYDIRIKSNVVPELLHEDVIVTLDKSSGEDVVTEIRVAQ